MPTMPSQRPIVPDTLPPTRPSVNSERRRARVPSTKAASPSTAPTGTATAASRRSRPSRFSANTIAAGTHATASAPSTTESRPRQLGSALLLLVRATTRCRWDGTADHAGDGDDREHIWQGLEQHFGLGTVDVEAEGDRGREAEQQRRAKGAEWAPVPEDQRSEADEALAGGHVLRERAQEADRQVDPAERREHPRERDGDVPRPVDRDADGVRRPWMLADRAQPQADRGLEDDDVRHDHHRERQPDHQVEVPDHITDERDVLDQRQIDVGDPRQPLARRARLAVEVDEQVARQSECEEVDRG